MAIVAGGGGMKSAFIKLTTPLMNVTSAPSEGTALTDLDQFITWDDTKQFTLATPESLKNEINQFKELHLRPISDSEYNTLISTLKEQKDKFGKQLFKYDLAAIARVVKENFEKWFPSIKPDYQVESALDFHFEVDNILDTMYQETLTKYREPFILSNAEEVQALYSDEEKNRLRSQGIAFLGSKYSALESIKNFRVGRGLSPSERTRYVHPMLKYNLLKGK